MGVEASESIAAEESINSVGSTSGGSSTESSSESEKGGVTKKDLVDETVKAYSLSFRGKSIFRSKNRQLWRARKRSVKIWLYQKRYFPVNTTVYLWL